MLLKSLPSMMIDSVQTTEQMSEQSSNCAYGGTASRKVYRRTLLSRVNTNLTPQRLEELTSCKVKSGVKHAILRCRSEYQLLVLRQQLAVFLTVIMLASEDARS